MHIHTNLQSLLLKKVLYQNTVPENVMDTLPKGEHTYTLAHKCRHAVYHAKMLSNQSKKLGSTSQIVAHYHGNTV